MDLDRTPSAALWRRYEVVGCEPAGGGFPAGVHLPQAALDLETTVRIAHRHGVPVIVDAAAQLPPAENLWRFTRDLGADAAVFSGGKALSGPQASGLMVGTREIIAAARANGSPHQRLARAMKAGKEEIAGLVAAVELFLKRDYASDLGMWEETVSTWVAALNEVRGLCAVREFPNEAGQPVPRVRVTVDSHTCGLTADEVRERLWSGNPRVLVLRADRSSFHITPDTLKPEETPLVANRIADVLKAC
jgi:seryl-tRNA(Sec) selenium transferase